MSMASVFAEPSLTAAFLFAARLIFTFASLEWATAGRAIRLWAFAFALALIATATALVVHFIVHDLIVACSLSPH